MTEKPSVERIMTVPLRRGFIKAPKNKKAVMAVRTLRRFVSRHTKTDEENVKISHGVNEKIWIRGIQKPPGKIRVKVLKEGDIVRVLLPEEQVKEKSEVKKTEESKEKSQESEKVSEKSEKKETESAKPSEIESQNRTKTEEQTKITKK